MTKVYDLNKLPWNSALSVVGNAVVIDLGGCVNKFAWMTTPKVGTMNIHLAANEFDKASYLPIKGWL